MNIIEEMALESSHLNNPPGLQLKSAWSPKGDYIMMTQGNVIVYPDHMKGRVFTQHSTAEVSARVFGISR